MHKIKIMVENQTFLATLNDSVTADQIWNALPIESRGSVWGEEIYFSIPVDLSEAPNAREEVDVGGLAYWPPGTAFCIFFGPTPVSRGDVPRAYSPVNVFGKIEGDIVRLKSVRNGATVRVEKA